MSKIASTHQELEEARKNSPLEPSEGAGPPLRICGLSASRMVTVSFWCFEPLGFRWKTNMLINKEKQPTEDRRIIYLFQLLRLIGYIKGQYPKGSPRGEKYESG